MLCNKRYAARDGLLDNMLFRFVKLAHNILRLHAGAALSEFLELGKATGGWMNPFRVGLKPRSDDHFLGRRGTYYYFILILMGISRSCCAQIHECQPFRQSWSAVRRQGDSLAAKSHARVGR